MHPYSKDTHSQPTINVNLTPCERHHLPIDKKDPAYHVLPGTGNLGRCESPPVLVPLSLQPFRSVTFTVRLGECTCGYEEDRVASERAHAEPNGVLGNFRLCHASDCPARPIRVTCSISGKTWDDSFVSDVDWQTRNERGDWNPSPMSPNDRITALRACGELWGLVKAVVLGQWPTVSSIGVLSESIPGLVTQRDAVYAAICKMARAERAMGPAHVAMFTALDAADVAYSALGPSSYPDAPFAERGLAAYVERIVEQVGDL